MNFLFGLYFIGILFATFQDFKRREIDDWLNLFILISGIGYLFIGDKIEIVSFAIFIFIMMLVSFGLYYMRFFAGGDATLLFAVTPLLYNPLLLSSLLNLFYFFIILVIVGTVYTLIYSFILFFRDFRKTSAKFKFYLKNKFVKISFCISLVILLFSFFDLIFILLLLYIFIFTLLFIFAKSLESVSLTKKIGVEKLREGDWLAEDVVIKNKVIKFSWDGLNRAEIKFLQRYKKFVVVKEGIPYALSFLLALVVYYFLDKIIILFK